MSHDSSSFVVFELGGTFTHIDYDCGHSDPPNPFAQGSSSDDEEEDSGPPDNTPYDNYAP